FSQKMSDQHAKKSDGSTFKLSRSQNAFAKVDSSISPCSNSRISGFRLILAALVSTSPADNPRNCSNRARARPQSKTADTLPKSKMKARGVITIYIYLKSLASRLET